MKLRNCHISLVFLLLCFQIVLKGQNMQHAQDNGINFQAVVGPGFKPAAVMVSSIPYEQIISECSFFKGDSLTGFDFTRVLNAAPLNGIHMYGEFKTFIFLKQAEFIKKKYNIRILPHEVAATNKDHNPPPVVNATCNNMDFENGDFSGWVTSRGYNENSNGPLTVSVTPAYLNINQDVHHCSDLNIISAAYGNDPYGGFPGLDPQGGAYSARVGGMDMNTSAGIAVMLCDLDKYKINTVDIPSNSNGEQLSQSFVVTAANALISYNYAVILNDGGHANGEQPYFHVTVTDLAGNLLNPCTEYYVQATAGVPPAGFVNSGTVNPANGTVLYSQSWVSNTVNLTPYIGQTVTITFTAAGCIYGGHMAWAYIEATCGPVDIVITPANPCAGGTAVFTAPFVAGGTYAWTGPGIIGLSTVQTVTVNTTGTYSVVVTPSQGAGCSYMLSVPVTFNSPSVSGTSATLTNCTSPNGTASANVTGGSGTYTYAWSPGGQTTQTATGLGAGNYTVVITDANGCTVVGTQSVSPYPPVVAAFSVTTVCLGNPTQFTDQSNSAATSWSWSFGDGNTSIQQSPSHSYTSAGTYSATLTSTGAGGCNSNVTHVVTVNPQPVANFSVVTVCFGNPTLFTDQSTGGANQWSWNFGDGNTSIQQSPSHTYGAAGTYTASLVATGTGGCNSIVANLVDVFPQPVASLTAPTVCLGNPTQFTDQTTGGATDWSWDFGDGNTDTQQNPSHTYSASGTYTATLTATALPGGCSSNFPLVITVNPQPVANYSVTTVCFGSPTQFTDLSTGGATQWSWNFGDGNTSNQQNTSNTYTAAGTYTATLTATGPGGCSSVMSQQVTVLSLPVPNFNVADICVNTNPAVITDLSLNTAQWSWNFGDGSPFETQQNPTHVYGAPGTYSITLVVQTADGCVDSMTQTIDVNPVPDAIFTSNIACFNNTTQFTEQSLGSPTQWLWNFGDPLSGTKDTSTLQHPTHIFSAPGTYTVILIATNALGCSDTLPLTALVNPLPAANFIAPTVCIGTSTCFKDTTTISSGVISTWSWNFDDLPSGSNNTSTVQSPCHLFTAIGTYDVILTVTSNNGCQSTMSKPIQVTLPPVASFTANTVCLNTPTQFTDMSTGSIQWFWNFGDGGTSTAQNPSHVYLGFGTYIVQLVASAGGICTDTILDTVTVSPVPIINFKSDSVCVGLPTTFTDASFIPAGSINAWSWNFGDPASGANNTSALQSPTHVFSSAGTYSVTLTATSALGCQGSKVFATLVHPGPQAEFSFSPASPITLTDLVTFSDQSTGSPVQWWWDFGDKDTSVMQNPEHLYQEANTYSVTLVVVTQNGCVDTVMHPLEILQFSFYIPNAFTPGTDGNNDFFFGKGVGIVEYEMTIFDRWGNQIFYCKINDLPQTFPCMWDGKVEAGGSNERVQEDVYVWKVKLLDIFGEHHKYIGTVTVVK